MSFLQVENRTPIVAVQPWKPLEFPFGWLFRPVSLAAQRLAWLRQRRELAKLPARLLHDVGIEPDTVACDPAGPWIRPFEDAVLMDRIARNHGRRLSR